MTIKKEKNMKDIYSKKNADAVKSLKGHLYHTYNDKRGNDTGDHLVEIMLNILQQEGYRITQQRRIILEAVASQVGWHVHAKSVFAYAHVKDKEIGMATVYRTLSLLEDMDMLNRVYSSGINMHPGTGHDHFHLVCMKCGVIQDIKEDLLPDISERVKKKYGFTVSDMNTTFYGICANCENK